MYFKRLIIALSLILSFTAQNVFADEKQVADKPCYIAIVIDDLGNDCEGTKEMLSLPIKITAAVMPHMPSSAKDAEDFYKAGKGVLLHMPMEPKKGKKSWMGDNAIYVKHSDEEVSERICKALDELKYADGVNNHMGSAVTTDARIMGKIASVVKERDLILLDSLTTPKSVVKESAEKSGAKCLTRDVFLDGTRDVGIIEKNLMQAVKIAKKNGHAIAIGHVGPEGGTATYKAIAKLYPELEKQGVKFVTIKELYEKIH